MNNNELKIQADNRPPALPPKAKKKLIPPPLPFKNESLRSPSLPSKKEKEILKQREWVWQENAKVEKNSLKYRPPSPSNSAYKYKINSKQ